MSSESEDTTFHAMPAQPEDSGQHRTANVELAIAGRKLRLQLSVSTGPARAGDFMPLFRSLSDSLAAIAVELVEGESGKISCQKKCAACCRQMVPLSEIEARAISDLVDAMPEPRRSVVRGRFAEARRKAEEAGLLADLMEIGEIKPSENLSFALEYFRQWITCPFLEDEMCSIYAERPIACREYMVITPADRCFTRDLDNVKSVRVRANLMRAMSRIGAGESCRERPWIALILACEWADAHPDESVPRPGTEIVSEFFSHLTGHDLPDSEEAGS